MVPLKEDFIYPKEKKPTLITDEAIKSKNVEEGKILDDKIFYFRLDIYTVFTDMALICILTKNIKKKKKRKKEMEVNII